MLFRSGLVATLVVSMMWTVSALEAGETCYQFFEDGSQEFVNARDDCAAGTTCQSTIPAGMVSWDVHEVCTVDQLPYQPPIPIQQLPPRICCQAFRPCPSGTSASFIPCEEGELYCQDNSYCCDVRYCRSKGPTMTDHNFQRLPVGTRVVLTVTNVIPILVTSFAGGPTFRVTDDNGFVVAVSDESSLSGDTYPYFSMSSDSPGFVEASLEFFITSEEELVSPLHVRWPTLVSLSDASTTSEAFSYYDELTLYEALASQDFSTDDTFKFKMGDKCLHQKRKQVKVKDCQAAASSQEVEFESSDPFLDASWGDSMKISVGGSWLKRDIKKERTVTKKQKKGGEFTLTPLYWTLAGDDKALWTFQILEEESGECLSFDEENNVMVFLPCMNLDNSERMTRGRGGEFIDEFINQAIDLEVIHSDCRMTGCTSNAEYCTESWAAPGIFFCTPDALVEVVEKVAESMLRPWSVAVLKTTVVTATADCTTAVGRTMCAVVADLENAF